MHFTGLIIGIATFLIIGIFHPIVIKTEYYIGKKAFPIFIILGIAFVLCSLLINKIEISAILGTVGFTCFWSVKELFEQEERVKKGWFPKNPNK
ncbi:MAG: DUF4491 family protein [Clostridia bacterium]